MRRFILLITTEDTNDLLQFNSELNSLLMKYKINALMDEAVNPFLQEQNKKTETKGYG